MHKVQVGVIGVGGIGSVHLKNIALNEQAKIVAVCDISEDQAIFVGKKYHVPSYTDVDKMLEENTMDALFICVPPFAHGDIEEKAAAKGIHLMVEKPVGLDLETVKKKYKVIKSSGIICATGYCLRYLDTVAKAKEYLQDKEIAMVNGYYLTKFVPTPWYRERSKSGGQLVEQATHTLDLIRYLTGDMDKIYANMNLLVSKDIPKIDIPDVTSVNFTLKNGAIGHLSCSFIQPDHRMGIEILGKDFRVTVDGSNVTIADKYSTITYRPTMNYYEAQDHAFIKAIATNQPDLILSSYENGVQTLTTTLAANISQDIGAPIDVSDYYASL
ncbi:Gfo/Idh/MocA family oxidoreductase [Niallia alba]|uniref:Gfo/Idh/MocA family protein n=1 Tax=Niallia alba TaxID=2729105 RepID=UPI002E1B08A0|nr:Gfo/Idh/MocA family oxidoreductase [Niallia alba]